MKRTLIKKIFTLAMSLALLSSSVFADTKTKPTEYTSTKEKLAEITPNQAFGMPLVS